MGLIANTIWPENTLNIPVLVCLSRLFCCLQLKHTHTHIKVWRKQIPLSSPWLLTVARLILPPLILPWLVSPLRHWWREREIEIPAQRGQRDHVHCAAGIRGACACTLQLWPVTQSGYMSLKETFPSLILFFLATGTDTIIISINQSYLIYIAPFKPIQCNSKCLTGDWQNEGC